MNLESYELRVKLYDELYSKYPGFDHAVLFQEGARRPCVIARWAKVEGRSRLFIVGRFSTWKEAFHSVRSPFISGR